MIHLQANQMHLEGVTSSEIMQTKQVKDHVVSVATDLDSDKTKIKTKNKIKARCRKQGDRSL